MDYTNIFKNFSNDFGREEKKVSQNSFDKPIKTKTISGKKVKIYNDNPIPKTQTIKKAYDKIPDDTNIPLKFMTRKQYLNQYVTNQEKKYNKKFSNSQRQKYVNTRSQEYKNIAGRYTTKKNPYYKPAVIIFNDDDNSKNIKGEEFKKVAWHEYGHELVEKERVRMEPQAEEDFCDYLAHMKVVKNTKKTPATLLKEYLKNQKEFDADKTRQPCDRAIKKDIYSKNTTQTLFYAGDEPPSQNLKERGRVYGFSNLDFAKGWQQKKGAKNIYQYQTSQYDLDPKNYVRKTPSGYTYNDNEYIATNVLTEKPVSDDYSKDKFTPFRNPQQAEEMSASRRFGGRNLQGLQRIGQGRDRTVYALDDDKVVKVAKNPGGLSQNVSEQDIEYLEMGEQVEKGKDYVVMKRQRPLSREGRRRLADIRKEVDEEGLSTSPGYNTQVAASLSKEDSSLQRAGVTTNILDFQPNPQEVFANRQWGEDEQGNLVLLDGGALQDNQRLSRYRVKDYKPSDWEYQDWRDVQSQRRQFRDKGSFDPNRKQYKGTPESPQMLQTL